MIGRCDTTHYDEPDILPFFDHLGSSNGSTEAINAKLDHLRGTALGCSNLTYYFRPEFVRGWGFRPGYTLNGEDLGIFHLKRCTCIASVARASSLSTAAGPGTTNPNFPRENHFARHTHPHPATGILQPKRCTCIAPKPAANFPGYTPNGEEPV
ncbi:Transposase [Corynebacterium uterequi]|uniref:Transposase n=1 Tax=Corynebacterium uterequi TaxID=1072256 RepID=A0A0G3HAG3_9CORY|nr:Transposase [Corynebacterium uterequi]